MQSSLIVTMINKQKISTFAFSSLNLGTFPSNCYIDDGTRDLDHYHEIPSKNTAPDSILWCRQYCGSAGFDYAGVQFTKQCFCGNQYGQFGKADDSDCNMICKDGINICGGGWRNNVYTSIR